MQRRADLPASFNALPSLLGSQQQSGRIRELLYQPALCRAIPSLPPHCRRGGGGRGRRRGWEWPWQRARQPWGLTRHHGVAGRRHAAHPARCQQAAPASGRKSCCAVLCRACCTPFACAVSLLLAGCRSAMLISNSQLHALRACLCVCQGVIASPLVIIPPLLLCMPHTLCPARAHLLACPAPVPAVAHPSYPPARRDGRTRQAG